jgi:hypothetical protein
MDIGGWLRSLGLERYEAAFRENEIDETVLPNLTQADLKEIGVGPVGHRRKLLAAIGLLEARNRGQLKLPQCDGSAALISGELGVDKSQIAEALQERIGIEQRLPEPNYTALVIGLIATFTACVGTCVVIIMGGAFTGSASSSALCYDVPYGDYHGQCSAIMEGRR